MSSHQILSPRQISSMTASVRIQRRLLRIGLESREQITVPRKPAREETSSPIQFLSRLDPRSLTRSRVRGLTPPRMLTHPRTPLANRPPKEPNR